MSFPKAKLKRFNDVEVINSPSPFKEKKSSSIFGKYGKFFDSSDKEKKTPLSCQSSVTSNDSEKSHKMRLFRTPSLPRRFKIRHHNPESHSCSKAASVATTTLSTSPSQIIKQLNFNDEKINTTQTPIFKKPNEEFNMIKVEISNLKARLKESRCLNDELKQQNVSNEIQIKDLHTEITNKNTEIAQLNSEINNANKNEILLNDIAKNSIKKITNFEDDIKNILIIFNQQIDVLLQKNKVLKEKNYALKYNNNSLIKDNEEKKFQINNLNNKINVLTTNNQNLLKEKNQLLKQNENDLIMYLEENFKHANLVKDHELKNNHIENDLLTKTTLIYNLEQELLDMKIEMDVLNDEKKLLTKNYNIELSKLLNEIEMIKTDKINEIKSINSVVEEKVKICEIQCEEKIKLLEYQLVKERQTWQDELMKCQKIAENEIIKYEFEKHDTKSLLELTTSLLESEMEKNNQLMSKEKLTGDADEIMKLRNECIKLQQDKYNYKVTLNNTRMTVNAIIDRLKASDNDVELLLNENKNLKNDLEETKGVLLALKNSATILEQEFMNKELIFNEIKNTDHSIIDAVNEINNIYDKQLNACKLNLYNDLKMKYDQCGLYIKEMKIIYKELTQRIQSADILIDKQATEINELKLQLKNATDNNEKKLGEEQPQICMMPDAIAPPVIKVTNDAPTIINKSMNKHETERNVIRNLDDKAKFNEAKIKTIDSINNITTNTTTYPEQQNDNKLLKQTIDSPKINSPKINFIKTKSSALSPKLKTPKKLFNKENVSPNVKKLNQLHNQVQSPKLNILKEKNY